MDCLARESASKALSTIRSVGPSISVDSEGLQIPSACDGQDGTREAMPPVGFGKIAWRSATMSEPGSAVRLESKPPRPEFCVHGPPRQLERLPAFVTGDLSSGPLSGDVRVREDLVQPAQPVRSPTRLMSIAWARLRWPRYSKSKRMPGLSCARNQPQPSYHWSAIIKWAPAAWGMTRRPPS